MRAGRRQVPWVGPGVEPSSISARWQTCYNETLRPPARPGPLIRSKPASTANAGHFPSSQPPYVTRVKRPLQLWRSRGPSVQGPVQLLRLVVTYAVQYGESLERFSKLSFRGEEERGLGKGMIQAGGVTQ